MTSEPTPEALIQQWRETLQAQAARARQLVSPLTQLERRQTPAARAWNVDQVLEHLVIANEAYARTMTRALDAAVPPGASTTGPWRATFVGRLLQRAVDPKSPRKIRSPSRSRPGPDVKSDVLERFTASVDALVAVSRRAEGRDLSATRFTSPIASFLRLNLGDGLAICAAHVTRHVNQIERTIAAIR